jgi:hypothetical protein
MVANGTRRSTRFVCSLVFLVLFAFCPGDVLAFTVHIDPIDYTGLYQITGQDYVTGPSTVELAEGTYQVLFSYNLFYFDVDASGNVTSQNPTAAVGDGNTLRFNTVTISVDPVDYAGRYIVPSIESAYGTGPRSVVLLPGLNNYRMALHQHSSTYFLFDVDASGNVTSQNPTAAVGDGNTLRFNTVTISIDPIDYTGRYIVSPVEPAYETGPRNVILLPGLNSYRMQLTHSGAGFGFGVDASGNVTSWNSAAAEGVGNTLVFKPTTISIDPSDYTGSYKVAYVGVWEPGPRNLVLLPGLNNYGVGLVWGGAYFLFDVDADGNVVSRNSAAYSGVGNTLVFHTTTIAIDPTSYTGNYAVSYVDPGWVSGPHSVILVQGLDNYIMKVSGADDFKFNLDAVGEPTPTSVVVDVGGESHTFLLSAMDEVLVSISDTTATYDQLLEIPIYISDTTTLDIVSAEVFVSYDGDLLTAFSTGLTGTLAASGWSVETNLIEGVGTNIDTVKIAMATDDDVLSGAGTLVHIDFQVGDVRSPASSPLTLEHVLFNDGDPGNTTVDGSVTLVGVDGSISHDPIEIIPREDIAVTVIDADENWDINAQDSFVVRVSNGSQSETLTVLETDNSTGAFEGMISTVFSLGATSDDDIVQAKAGDVIQSCYDDWLDASGNTVERCADTNVIGGTDGAIQVTIVSQPGDTVRVRVTDADLNTSPGAQESVQVTAANPTTGESETIDLDEDGDNSDVFFGLLFTAPGSAAGPSGDAAFNTARGDVIGITYTDVVTAPGGTEDLTDDDEVVDPFGDADGNGSVQAFDAAKVLLHALSPYLTGLDSLSANLDLLAFDPVHGKITHFDASLVLQKRVGLIGRFPVQEDNADNHPQPETDDSTPKMILDERLLSLQTHDEYVSVWADDRSEIVSGELVVEGVSGAVEMGEELGGFLSASRETEEGLRIVFAGASPVEGSGELLRIHSGVGPGNVRLTRARFNDGGIVGWYGGTDLAEVSPQRFALHPNVPNPFNPETMIRFDLPYRASVRLEVFDVLGQRMRVLVAGTLSGGIHEAMWDGRDQAGTPVSSGLYLYRLQAGEYEQMRRMLLLK